MGIWDSDLLSCRRCWLGWAPPLPPFAVEQPYRRVLRPIQLHLNAIFVNVTYVSLQRTALTICPYRSHWYGLFSSNRSAYFYISHWIELQIPIELYSWLHFMAFILRCLCGIAWTCIRFVRLWSECTNVNNERRRTRNSEQIQSAPLGMILLN